MFYFGRTKQVLRKLGSKSLIEILFRPDNDQTEFGTTNGNT